MEGKRYKHIVNWRNVEIWGHTDGMRQHLLRAYNEGKEEQEFYDVIDLLKVRCSVS